MRWLSHARQQHVKAKVRWWRGILVLTQHLWWRAKGKAQRRLSILSRCSAVAHSFYAKALLNGKFKPTFTSEVFSLIFQVGIGFSIWRILILCDCSWSGFVAHFNTCKETRATFALLFPSLIDIRDGSSYWGLASGSALAVNPSRMGAFGIWRPAFTRLSGMKLIFRAQVMHFAQASI